MSIRILIRIYVLGALAAILGAKPGRRRRWARQTIGWVAILVILVGIAYLSGGGK